MYTQQLSFLIITARIVYISFFSFHNYITEVIFGQHYVISNF
jgi:hypothetical protein